MPPKTARKSVGPARRGGRTRGTPVPEESLNPMKEENPVDIKEDKASVEVKEEEKIEEIPVVDNGTDHSKGEDSYVKDSIEEYEKGERLELEDNDPEESELEEYEVIGDDYDEKEVVEDVNDGEEEVEEEGGNIHEIEMEGSLEHEEEHEQAADEHADLVDEQEHHDVFKERRKRKEFEIFVGGLDKDATEEDLRKVFSEVGEVLEVRLRMNAQTKNNKGFAFIRFATVKQAKRACVELKNPVVHGKLCGVSPSEDNDTLFLGNICKTWTKEALKEKLKAYGIDSVEDLTLVEDNKNDGNSRGFAFLEFSSRSDAMDAFKRLQRRDVTFGVDRPVKVSFADSFIDPGDEIMAQVKTVIVDGLPASWDEDRVRGLLKKYGKVEKIELARNMPAARRKDYGFITFGTHDAALTCAEGINNEELGDGENKVKVRARLSRPFQRNKVKHISCGDYRPSRPPPVPSRGPRARHVPRGLPPRGRPPPVVNRTIRRPVGLRDRRPVALLPPRARPVAPLPRSYDRKPPVSLHSKNSLKREYSRREDLPPRSRAVADYGAPWSALERNPSYPDDYHPSRGPTYADLPRGPSHSKKAYTDGGYSTRYERLPPSYRETRLRDHDPVPGSKRPYAALDDVPPRYADAEPRQQRLCLDYEMRGGSSQYGDAYSERVGRSTVGGYGRSRSSMSGTDSHGVYSSSRRGMSYGAGSYSGGGVYSSSYAGDYSSRGGDVGGRSYTSSMYSGRSLGGGGLGSYY